MRVLAFDTSTELLTMAVVEDERLVGELSVLDDRGPTEHLVLLLKGFLEDLGLAIADMDGLAVGTGPGSWTGARVGVTTAKVFAFATGSPIVGVSSFDAMVHGCGVQDGPVCVLSAFGRDRVFTATYEVREGTWARATDYRAVGRDEAVADAPRGTTFIGPGAVRHRQALSEIAGSIVLPQIASPSAHSVAVLGLGSLQRGEQDAPPALVPIYVALPQAEVARRARES